MTSHTIESMPITSTINSANAEDIYKDLLGQGRWQTAHRKWAADREHAVAEAGQKNPTTLCCILESVGTYRLKKPKVTLEESLE